MPHCVIQCSSDINKIISLDKLVKVIHVSTMASGLFSERHIKCRLLESDHYLVGGTKAAYVHVIAHILSGRSVDQKKQLASLLVQALTDALPNVQSLSVDVQELNPQIYSKREA